MITKVKLVNWKTHKSSELEFSEGTNVIVGINGAGKSSIMDAISFALFGTYPRLNSREEKLDEVISNKPSKAKEASVSLEFLMNGKKYNVLRVIERGKGTTYCEVRENDKLLESANSQRVTEVIERILKMDYELFSRAIYSEQNRIDYFIELSPVERAQKIDNLLRIDKFEEVRKNAVNLEGKLQAEKESINNFLKNINLEEKEREVKNLEEEIRKIKEEEEKMLIERRNLEITLAIKEKKLNDLENDKIRLEKLKQKIESLKEEIERDNLEFEKEEKILHLYSQEEIERKIKEISENIALKEKEYEEKNQESERLFLAKSKEDSEMNFLIKRNREIEKEMDVIRNYETTVMKITYKYSKDIESLIEDERKRLDEVNSRISVLNYKREEAEKALNQLESITNKCPVCGSDISLDKKKHLLHIKKEDIKGIERDLEAASNEMLIIKNNLKVLEEEKRVIDDARKHIENKGKLEEELSENIKRIREYQQSSENIGRMIEKIKGELDSLRKEVDFLKKEELEKKNLLEKIGRLNELRRKIQERKNELLDLEVEKDKLEKIMEKENYDELRKEYDSLLKKYGEIKAIIDERKRKLDEKSNLLEKLKSEIQKFNRDKEYALRLDEAIINLRIFIDAIKKTQDQLRTEFIEAVNEEMSRLWEILYPYSDYTNVRLSVQDGKYQLQLQNLSGETVNIGNVSGGERTMACLVLRISFSLVLVPNLSWIILDEPTHNLDAKSIEALTQALKSQIKDFIGQVFLITHEPKLENAASGELYKIERDKDADGYSEIIRLTEI